MLRQLYCVITHDRSEPGFINLEYRDSFVSGYRISRMCVFVTGERASRIGGERRREGMCVNKLSVPYDIDVGIPE